MVLGDAGIGQAAPLIASSALQMVLTRPERRFGSVLPAATITGVLLGLYLLEARLGLALPRVRRWVERRRPKPAAIEYQI